MTENKYKDIYTCKRMRMLEYLKKRGYTPYATIPDPTNARYNWWLFENSAEFEQCVNEYFAGLKSKQIN
jgi:hypothetical protein